MNKRTQSIASQVRHQSFWKTHPFMVILGVCMLFSGFVFLLMVGLYAVQRYGTLSPYAPIYTPRAFIGSAMILIISSLSLIKSKHAMLFENARLALRWLALALLLGLSFAVLQLVGWAELHAHGSHFPDLNVAGSYVFVITGIHLLHVAVAFVLLAYIYVSFYKKSRDVVSRLILETNPYEIHKLNVAFRLWHFVVLLWVILFSVFLCTF